MICCKFHQHDNFESFRPTGFECFTPGGFLQVSFVELSIYSEPTRSDRVVLRDIRILLRSMRDH
jgi:hypothetical protein